MRKYFSFPHFSQSVSHKLNDATKPLWLLKSYLQRLVFNQKILENAKTHQLFSTFCQNLFATTPVENRHNVKKIATSPLVCYCFVLLQFGGLTKHSYHQSRNLPNSKTQKLLFFINLKSVCNGWPVRIAQWYFDRLRNSRACVRNPAGAGKWQYPNTVRGVSLLRHRFIFSDIDMYLHVLIA